MARSNTIRMAMDPKSWGTFKRQLDALEKPARKQASDAALQQAGNILKDEANSRAPGPHVIAEVTGGRSLRKLKKSAGVKANARVVAVGPDRKHWHYRWAEFGARPHNVAPRTKEALKLYRAGGVVRKWAKQAGGIRAFAFLRRAFSSKGDAAIKSLGEFLKKEIEKVRRVT